MSRRPSLRSVAGVSSGLLLLGLLAAGLLSGGGGTSGAGGGSDLARSVGVSGAAPAQRLPLHVRLGERLAGWTLTAIRPPDEDGLPLDFRHGGAIVTVWIAPRGSTGHLPPSSTERHDLFISNPYPPDAGPTAPDRGPLLEAVAERLRVRERGEPPAP